MTDEPPPEPHEKVPHSLMVIGLTYVVLAAFGAVSAYMLIYSDDATIKGSIVGTWTALAGAAGQFWLGSSSGGKLKK